MTRPTSPSVLFLVPLLLTPPAASGAQAGPRSVPPPAVGALALAAPESVQGERLGPSALGPGVIEGWDVVLERERGGAFASAVNPKARNGAQGVWFVPSRRFSDAPHSGEHYASNKWGDTRMGIGFGRTVDVAGAWLAGQGDAGAWTTGVRAIGYRSGLEVGSTGWFTDVDDSLTWFAIDLRGVDRIELVARPRVDGGGWYALDDLTFAASAGGAQVVIDFEDCEFGQKLSGSDYRGLAWETGSGDFAQQGDAQFVNPPGVPPGLEEPKGTGGGQENASLGGGGTAPQLGATFQGPRFGDAGANLIPPDTCGTAGPAHFVAVVNANISVYDKATGLRVLNSSLASFFGVPGFNGDPRAVWDPHAQRFAVLSCDFNTDILFAYSLSSDPTGMWFKTTITLSQGSDAGQWPDYPTLGVDADGIYVSAFMVSSSMSIFAIDKAPLLAATPSLGAVTAFRNLPYEGAIQPCVTYGSPSGEYFVSRPGSTTLRIRRVNPPLSAPTLTNVGLISVPSNSSPPNAPALGSNTALDTLDGRLMNAVYRNGAVWTAHCVSISTRAGVRWYQLDPVALSTQQVGSVSDPSLSYYMPSIAVDANEDVVLGFSGSDAAQFVGTYLTGRVSTDQPGETAPPVQYQVGLGPYNNLDGGGSNRWGDYSLTSVDAADDQGFWTIQEYARTGNSWGTWIAEADFGCAFPPTVYCTAKVNSQLCFPLIASTGFASASDPAPFLITASEVINNKFGLLFYGTNGALGAPFQGGFLCVKAPTVRTSTQNSGGSATGADCTGTYSYDFNARIQSGQDPDLVPLATVNAQYWYRDPNDPSGFTTGLTDGIEFVICP